MGQACLGYKQLTLKVLTTFEIRQPLNKITTFWDTMVSYNEGMAVEIFFLIKSSLFLE